MLSRLRPLARQIVHDEILEKALGSALVRDHEADGERVDDLRESACAGSDERCSARARIYGSF